MTAIAPFRTFVNAAGISPYCVLLPHNADHVNLYANAHTLAYWYWMLCGITIQLEYMIDGGNQIPIRHEIKLNAHSFGVKERIQGLWALDGNKHDPEFDISSVAILYLLNPYWPPQTMASPKPTLELQTSLRNHSNLVGADTIDSSSMRFGLCFKFVEKADSGDFAITTCADDINGTVLHKFTTKFIDQDLTFTLSTPFSEDINGQITHVNITPEFFEIQT